MGRCWRTIARGSGGQDDDLTKSIREIEAPNLTTYDWLDALLADRHVIR